MITRLMATAFLFNNDKILMMKRSADRKLAPGIWTGIGGHIEPDEMNSSEYACVREVHEETGIERDQISDLSLRYILLRQKENELREQFVYFGKTSKQELGQTEEGELHWIDIQLTKTLEMPMIIYEMLNHYFQNGIKNDETYIGILTRGIENEPKMIFTTMKDPGIV
ncbi:NUDIX domain-containing protein [Paenibacillus sp. HB172176]|uniref:NUDIX domain-containing protein n=1 Tax=Paenibacillus sp. HB172176 TaxID=2493690 RepID=UPI00143905DF|nr:NUDIX domain-containing protein [Paenibacillus sp. HB172176]